MCIRDSCRAQMGARRKFIGITGGVGAGKSLVLSTLKEAACCRVLPADDVGNAVKLPGQPCYEALAVSYTHLDGYKRQGPYCEVHH